MFKQLSEDILYKRKCEFLKKAKEIHNGKYSYDNFVFKNKTTKSIITCPIHGDFEQTPKNHFKGQGCPICGKELARNMHKHNYLHFIQKSKERFGDKFDFPYIETEYENSHSKLTIHCKDCGNVFRKIACDHITSNNGGCKGCVNGRRIKSKIEKFIGSYLDENNIKYEREKTFEWLKYKINLYIDFYIADLNIGIECQGRQHYVPVDFGGKGYEWALSEFNLIQERDKTKYELCKEHGITILYINELNKNDIKNIIKAS